MLQADKEEGGRADPGAVGRVCLNDVLLARVLRAASSGIQHGTHDALSNDSLTACAECSRVCARA